MADDQSPEVRAFLEEIAQVCRKHGKVLTVSDYDTLQVWPLDEDRIEYILDAGDRCDGRAR